MERIVMDTAITQTGFCCSCDLLDGWVCTGSHDFEDFKKYVQESLDVYVEWAKEDGREYPSFLDGDYEIIYKFDVRSLLDFYRGIFSFAALQQITGINQKQLAHYASGLRIPRPVQAEKIRVGLHKLAKQMMTVTV